VRSLNSLRAYARDIVVWMRFLDERRDGKSLWSADRDDIAAFHEVRRLSEPPFRMSASSWNRMVAALDKLYRWAVDEKIIASAPFTYRQLWSRASTSGAVMAVAVNCAKESGARNGDMRAIWCSATSGFAAGCPMGGKIRRGEAAMESAMRCSRNC
jgi:hypothetical protein